jgi:hypothetical protein
MTWWTRATNETPGSATIPPMSYYGRYLTSDVVDVSGVGVSSGTTTDTYVLQVSFSPSQLGSSTPLANFQAGCLWLGTYNTSGGTGAEWKNAASLDSSDGQYYQFDGTSTPSGIGYNGSWNSFWAALQTAHPGATLNSVLGAWGVDPTNDVAWTVVDYDNAQFAVVAEPGTFVLLAAGALALIPIIRRRRKKASKKA